MTAPEEVRTQRREVSWPAMVFLTALLLAMTAAGLGLVPLAFQQSKPVDVAQGKAAAPEQEAQGETVPQVAAQEVADPTEPTEPRPPAGGPSQSDTVQPGPDQPGAVQPNPVQQGEPDEPAADSTTTSGATVGDPMDAAHDDARPSDAGKPDDLGSEPAAGKESLAPWSDVLAQEGPIPDFLSICFDGFDPSLGMMRTEQLQRWLLPIEGQTHRLDSVRNRWGLAATIRGTVQLQAPWRDDVALRLVLESYDRLQLHFWSGRTGVTLVSYQRSKDAWAAFATRRKVGEPRPDRFELLATDDDRNFRAEARQGGEYLLRYQDKSLILSRGDIVLLRVPLAEPPQQVVWEGNGAVLDMTLVRCGPVPDPPQPAPPTLDSSRPDQLSWQRQLTPASWLESLPDGALQLSAHQAPQRGWVTTPLPAGGPQEVVLEVDEATPGTGIFLGRLDGQPREVLRYAKHLATGGTCLMLVMDDDQVQANLPPPQERPLALVGRRHWLRLVFGCGQLRWWVSGDGRNWAEPERSMTRLPAGITTLGLHHVARADDCRIRLARVTLRPLQAIHGLADAPLVAEAPLLLEPADLAGWQREVDQRRPADVDDHSWRKACAVRMLGSGPAEPLGHAVLAWLWDDLRGNTAATEPAPEAKLPDPLQPETQVPDARKPPWDSERLVAVLDEMALLTNLRDDRNLLLSFLARYQGLIAEPPQPEPSRPYSNARRALMTAPIHTPHAYAITSAGDIRYELLELLYAGRFAEVAGLCRQLRYFHLENSQPLLPWAESLTRAYLPDEGPSRPSKRQSDWQHPLWEELNKDTYNTLAELRAVCESESWEDAARMIADLRPAEVQGLAPDAADDDLLVSLAAALREFQQRPELAQVMQGKLAQLAQLRVAKAVAEDDSTMLELAALQFAGTEAAAESHGWLGHQALAQGWFARAEAEFDRGLETAGVALRRSLLAGRRLAAAMQGRDLGPPVATAVELAGVSMTAEQFEALIQEMLARPAIQTPPLAIQTQSQEIPAGESLQLRRHGALDGPVGEQPASEVTRQTNQLRIAWVERQLAPVVAGDRLLVSNRFQVTAYDLQSGQKQWQASLPDKMLRAQDWTCVPMFPLSSGGRVFARLLVTGGPVLVCLDEASGNIVWSGVNQPQEFLVSDPLAARGEHYILTMVRGEQPEATLQLVRFHPDTGEPIARRTLLTLRDVWWTRHCCTVTLYQDRLLVALGGVLLSCDLDGNVHWVRKQIVLPPNGEPDWIGQYIQRPLVEQGLCFTAQPGVRTVECVATDTGRRVWQRTLPDIRRLVGLSGPLILVETERQLLALRREEGNTVWSRELPDTLEARLCDDRFVVIASRQRQQDASNQYVPRLQWLRTGDGQLQATLELEALTGADPRLGPLVVCQDRLLGFYGTERNQPQRELIELGPAR